MFIVQNSLKRLQRLKRLQGLHIFIQSSLITGFVHIFAGIFKFWRHGAWRKCKPCKRFKRFKLCKKEVGEPDLYYAVLIR